MELHGAGATEALGCALAAALRPGDVVALSGALGSGKTVLARGVLRGLGFAGEAPSPTFALVQHYAPPEVRLPLGHVDLYRLDDAREAEQLGLDEMLEESALLVEWPERLGLGLWDGALRLRIDTPPGASDVRRLTATVPPGWEARWPPRR